MNTTMSKKTIITHRQKHTHRHTQASTVQKYYPSTGWPWTNSWQHVLHI